MKKYIPEEDYAKVCGVRPSKEQLGRWHRLQSVLEIGAGDALWAIIIAFDFYQFIFERNIAESIKLIEKVVFWLHVCAGLLLLIIIKIMIF